MRGRRTSSGLERPAAARPEMCPSCERFIGPVDACPYCGADSVRSPAMRFLRRGTLALGMAGLFFLYLHARGRQPPGVRIGDITPLDRKSVV